MRLRVMLGGRGRPAREQRSRRRVWWLFSFVLLTDAFVGVLLATGTLTGGAATVARESSPPTQETAPPDYGAESLRLLGEQLSRRAAELERRETALREMLRGGEVLRRAGIEPVVETPASTDPAPGETEAERARSESFTRLQRAYENMEPESAALALAELAARDKDAVVELLLGWKPRTSGSILDALTQTDPGLAADLSYEIWRRSGNERPGAASSGR